MPSVYDVAARFRADLLARERNAASEMVRRYGEVWQRVRNELEALANRYYEAQERGEQPTLAWLYERDRLVSLLAQVEREIYDLARWAEPRVLAEQWEAVQAARRYAREVVEAVLPEGMIMAWGQAPMEAFTDLVGFTAAGSPLRELLDELGPQASEAIRRALTTGIALGHNPRRIAREARAGMGMSMTRLLRVARTEVLRAYREAALRDWQANSWLVEGWEWVAAKQARTCAACLAMDGTRHKLDERLDDHPNGRCVAVPILRGLTPQARETGGQWFARQNEQAQRSILGNAGYEAYRAGVVDLRDFVGQKRSREWGTTRYARSLSDILGERKAKEWGRAAKG